MEITARSLTPNSPILFRGAKDAHGREIKGSFHISVVAFDEGGNRITDTDVLFALYEQVVKAVRTEVYGGV